MKKVKSKKNIMNKSNLLVLLMLCISSLSFSQVGIDNDNPKATLDVTGKPATISAADGIIAPRLTGNELKAKDNAYSIQQQGAIAYITAAASPTTTKTANVTSAGYYYYDGSLWKALLSTPVSFATIGDVKNGFQATDHDGWIKLDGRLISTLTATQQTQATNLGFGTNLPNATNAFLVQNGGVLGAVSGSNTKTLTQANLPNVTLTSSSDGNHSHTVPDTTYSQLAPFGGGGRTTWEYEAGVTRTTSANGLHSHTVPLGGSNTPLDITPRSVSVNVFVYLGN
jgi:hypothetical protein